MNKREFKRLVRPYITKGRIEGKANSNPRTNKTIVRKELILQDFESREPETPAYIIIENKLVFIPADGFQTQKMVSGTFVFSDDSKMYCWNSKAGIENSQSWYHTSKPGGWNQDFTWILRHQSMSAMNKGKGWNFGTNKIYYVLETPKLKLINWINNNPLEVKE